MPKLVLTPQQIEICTTIFSYISPCTSIFIAGGFTVDANCNKSQDIDLWFAKKNEAAAKKFFNALPYHQLSNPEGNALYMSSGASVLGEGFILGIPFPIQVITTLHESAQETIDSFDISTHAHAVLSRDLRVVSGKESTTIFEAPQVVGKARSKTLARYVKICLRYGFTPDEKILKELTEDALIQKISSAPATPNINLNKLAEKYLAGGTHKIWQGQVVTLEEYNQLAFMAATKHIGAKVASSKPVVSQEISLDDLGIPF